MGDNRVELPLERWMPQEETTSEGLRELPPRLGVTQAEIDDAKSRLRGNAGLYYVSETTLDAGQKFFVVGRLEDQRARRAWSPIRCLRAWSCFPAPTTNTSRSCAAAAAG